jgi:hypothetical protein
MSRGSGVLLLAPVWLALGALGCGGAKAPDVHPVKGKVVFDKGDVQKLVGATVEFESVADPLIHAYGPIQEGGVFAMSTQTKGVAQIGAVPGEHRVRIIFEVNEDDDNPKKRPPPIVHPRFTRFKDSGLKCTVPMEGELILNVSR